MGLAKVFALEGTSSVYISVVYTLMKTAGPPRHTKVTRAVHFWARLSIRLPLRVGCREPAPPVTSLTYHQSLLFRLCQDMMAAAASTPQTGSRSAGNSGISTSTVITTVSVL